MPFALGSPMPCDTRSDLDTLMEHRAGQMVRLRQKLIESTTDLPSPPGKGS
jgi:hypothetical protein